MTPLDSSSFSLSSALLVKVVMGGGEGGGQLFFAVHLLPTH